MKTFIFEPLSNNCDSRLAGNIANCTTQRYQLFDHPRVVEISRKSSQTTLLSNFNDGRIILHQFKLIPPYTPEYIITGCKGTTTSIIRNGHGIIQDNSTKQGGATSYLKPKRYTATDTTGSHRFKRGLFSLYTSLRGDTEGINFFCLTQPTPSLWVATKN